MHHVNMRMKHEQASEGFSALLGHKRPSSRSSSAEGRRPQGTHRRRSSDCSSPARELHQEVVRLQAELDRMAQRLKVCSHQPSATSCH